MTRQNLEEAQTKARECLTAIADARRDLANNPRTGADEGFEREAAAQIASLEAELRMAESEVVRLSNQLLLEQAEGERDRAIADAKSSKRMSLILAFGGIVATLLAGALPLICFSKPPPAPINEVKVYPPAQSAPIVNVQVLPAPVVIQPMGAKK